MIYMLSIRFMFGFYLENMDALYEHPYGPHLPAKNR